ncbi:pyridoxal phosphate-dependent aminotransferase [Streptomyces sp. NPDC052036]|uniref:pyridoxal phosphate-dependent aminotransferase n=1 Tax=unclassified Streptomyces TaxID=2593676 RepID=UPI0034160C3E
MMHKLDDIAGCEGTPNPYDDVARLRHYAAGGRDLGQAIYLSLGETWTEVAPGLRAALAGAIPAYAHGYILSPYGLPALHEVLRDYISADHSLHDVAVIGRDYEVAVSQSSTRSAMFHFGRLLLEEQQAGPAVAICSAPGWDYAGIFAPLGFQIRPFVLSRGRGFQPDSVQVEEVVREARRTTRGPVLLALNAQHNPTGANWDEHTVRAMIQTANDYDVALLVDDAFYAVHDPGHPPTPTLRILLEETGMRCGLPSPRWLAVRSLGKQFHCNGWGIGAMTAAPDTLAQLLTRLLPQHTYVSAVPLQAAMAEWLQTPASAQYLELQRHEYAQKRQALTQKLTQDLGYPNDAVFAGECASFLIAKVPPWYEADAPAVGSDYRGYCLERAGVLPGEAHMTTPGQQPGTRDDYIRVFLGAPRHTLEEALDRMQAAGLTWNGRPHTRTTAEGTPAHTPALTGSIHPLAGMPLPRSPMPSESSSERAGLAS